MDVPRAPAKRRPASYSRRCLNQRNPQRSPRAHPISIAALESRTRSWAVGHARALTGGEVCGTSPRCQCAHAGSAICQRGPHRPPESSASISPSSRIARRFVSTVPSCSPGRRRLGARRRGHRGFLTAPGSGRSATPGHGLATPLARDRDQAPTLTIRLVDGVELVEPCSTGRAPSPRVVAAAPDGATVATSSVGPGQTGPLVLASADGSSHGGLLPGVGGAAFEPAGNWLAGWGPRRRPLWRVDLGDWRRGPRGRRAAARLRHHGAPDGRDPALLLSSVEARIGPRPRSWMPRGARPSRVAGRFPHRTSSCTVRWPSPMGRLSRPPSERRRAVSGAGGCRRVETPDQLRTVQVDRRPQSGGSARCRRREHLAEQIGNGPPPRDWNRVGGSILPDGTLLLLVGAVLPRSSTLPAATRRAGPSACWIVDGRGAGHDPRSVPHRRGLWGSASSWPLHRSRPRTISRCRSTTR